MTNSSQSNIAKETILLPIDANATLCLHRFYQKGARQPVFMLHGAIENGQIFYSRSGKGFAYFLAENGYDVFVGDLRGRGASFPRIGKNDSYGQTEAITEDIPCFIDAIRRLHPHTRQIWVAHSWGGVLLSSYLARFARERDQVVKCVYFASKRSVRVKNLHRYFYVDLMWKTICPILAHTAGFLPAKGLKIGSDNETRKSLQQSIAWVKAKAWIDPDDSFPYGEALKRGPAHPPVLMITGCMDRSLGHPSDVYRFQHELCAKSYAYIVLSKASNARHNYDHIDILTHPDAPRDHFPRIINWLRHDSFS